MFFMSCNVNKKSDAAYQAGIYCKCMQEVSKRNKNEWTYCHSKMLAENKFYRYYYLNLDSKVLSKGMKDSTLIFMRKFNVACQKLGCVNHEYHTN